MKPQIHQGKLDGKGFRFAIVVSRWNDFLTSRLLEGALDALERLGVEEKDIQIFKVPGSFEIPLTALKLARSRKFDAIICLGVIIRGETPHFEYVAGEAAKGIGQVAMQTDVPVLFGIVTADTVQQAMDRAGVKMGNKGFEAAMAAVEIVNLYKNIENLLKKPNDSN
ncbi:MAG: 6,7-dimethyl-8-ribityllumazine synthase [Acidobacteria bacterium]|nr:MAG: 6,7-dimethyl-8-ribityllumazine synthase [Acidobacteriota bacterium]GIU82794.1 MAG: 6,7-dimethyl-8-ribityllumazine synthase [Pyrinomonadaceae bacterium]